MNGLGKPPQRLGGARKRAWTPKVQALLYGPMPSYTTEREAWDRRMRARLYAFADSQGFVNRNAQDILVHFVLDQQQFFDSDITQDHRERYSIILARQHIRGVRERNKRLYTTSQDRKELIADLTDAGAGIDTVVLSRIISRYISSQNEPDVTGAFEAIRRKKEESMANKTPIEFPLDGTKNPESAESFNMTIGAWLPVLKYPGDTMALDALIAEALGTKPEQWNDGTVGKALGLVQAKLEAVTGNTLSPATKPTDTTLNDTFGEKAEPPAKKRNRFSGYFGWLTKTMTEVKADPKWEDQLRDLVALKVTSGANSSFTGIPDTVDIPTIEKVTLDFLHLFTPPTSETWKLFLKDNHDPKGEQMLAALSWKDGSAVKKLSEFGGVLYEAGRILDEYDHMKAQEPANEAEEPDTPPAPPAIENAPTPPFAPSNGNGNGTVKEKMQVIDMTDNPFKPATRESSYLRMALAGPSGSGKTYTALNIAKGLVPNGRIAVIDTERGSARKYGDLFKFDVLEMKHYAPEEYVKAIQMAVKYQYDVLVIDSLSHVWNAAGGILSIVDSKGGGFDKWKTVNPVLWNLINTILDSQIHLIATMRVKMDYVQQEVERNGRKTMQYVKVGLAPVMKDDIQYEFDIFAEIDIDNTMHISKSRCPLLQAQEYPKAGPEVATILNKWLTVNGQVADKVA